MLVGVVDGDNQLGGEPTHERVGNHAVFEGCAEAGHGLAHELEDEADVGAVGALVLKVLDEVADVVVAELGLVAFAEVSEDLALEDGLSAAVGVGPEDFEGEVLLLVVVTAERLAGVLVCRRVPSGGARRWTHSFVVSSTNQTVE